jgi:hypothetical protein
MICSDSGEEIRRYLVYITNDKVKGKNEERERERSY